MSNKTSFWATLPGCMILILVAIAGYSVLKGHGMHIVQWLPFLIILLCPLMHIFMHRGHGHSDHDSSNDNKANYDQGYTDALRDQQADTAADSQRPND